MKITFVTGTRADFGKLRPLIEATVKASFEVDIFITGMHLMEKYGRTVIEVRRLKNVKFHEFINQREGDNQDLILSKTLVAISDFIAEHSPDLVVIHGDRVEALAASLASAIAHIPSAHIEGGELSGTIDEVYRHCNTKLCRHHFVSSQEAALRVRNLGEDPEVIHIIGSPEMDIHSKKLDLRIEDVKSRYEINFKDYGILIFHPVSSEIDTIGIQARNLIQTLIKSKKQFVAIYPNNDDGHNEIMKELDRAESHGFRLIRSMQFESFSVLMRNASCIIGNSSAGVREAPFIGVPSLNVGTRQFRRSQSKSVTDVNAAECETINDFLSNEWGKRYSKSNEFGVGGAAEKFLNVLRTEKFGKIGPQKYFNDLT